VGSALRQGADERLGVQPSVSPSGTVLLRYPKRSQRPTSETDTDEVPPPLTVARAVTVRRWLFAVLSKCGALALSLMVKALLAPTFSE